MVPPTSNLAKLFLGAGGVRKDGGTVLPFLEFGLTSGFLLRVVNAM